MENQTNQEAKASEEVTLPALQKEVNSEIAQQKEQDKDFLIRLQRYSKLNNRPVEEGKMKDHPYVKGTKYLPISFMEMALDRIYFGLWSTDNFRWTVVMNEITASIDVKVFHPVAKVWITRTGASALKVMTDKIPKEIAGGMSKQDQNKWHLDSDNKKPNALEAGGFAKLKAECFKNAVQSIGKYFGRDANRGFEEEFTNLMTDVDAEIARARRMVSEQVDLCQDEEIKKDIIERILEAEKAGTNTPEFYQGIYFELAPSDGDN